MPPFQKGWKGGPGRPKGWTTLRTELMRRISEVDEDGIPHRTKIARTLIRLAEQGSVEAAKLIFDRLEGKVPEQAAWSGELIVSVLHDRLGGAGAPALEAPTQPVILQQARAETVVMAK